MAKIALCLSSEDLKATIENWLRNDFEQNEVVAYDSIAKFLTSLDPPVPDPSAEATTGPPLEPLPDILHGPPKPGNLVSAPKVEPVALPQFDMLIVQFVGSVSERAAVQQLKMKSSHTVDGVTHIPKLLVVSELEGGDSNLDARLKEIDDWLVLPLDRQVFAQKIEILLSEKPDSRPSFLFRSPLKANLQIAKPVQLIQVDELGALVINSRPLKAGILGQLALSPASQLPSSDNGGKTSSGDLRNWVRVVSSVPHAKGGYEVHLRWMGIDKTKAQNLRKLAQAKDPHRPVPKPALSIAPMKKILLHAVGEGTQKAGVGIFSSDSGLMQELASALEKEVSGISLIQYKSVSRLAKLFADQKPVWAASAAASAPAPAVAPATAPANGTVGTSPSTAESENEPDTLDLTAIVGQTAAGVPYPKAQFVNLREVGKELLVQVNGLGLFEKFLSDNTIILPESTEAILGTAAEKLTDKPDWLSASLAADEPELWQEFLETTLAIGHNEEAFSMRMTAAPTDSGKPTSAVRVLLQSEVLTKGENPERTRLSIRVVQQEGQSENQGLAGSGQLAQGLARSLTELRNMKLLILDARASSDPQALIDRIEALWEQHLPELVGLPVFAITQAGEARIGDSRDVPPRGAVATIQAPIDHRHLSLLLVEVLNTGDKPVKGVELKEASPLAVRSSREICYLSQPAELFEISEFGITLIGDRPFKTGVCLQATFDIFGPHGIKSFLVRSTGAVLDEETKRWRTYFSFWSVQDDLLKMIRIWIRDEYIHKKEGAA